jgi:hypothetical protein
MLVLCGLKPQSHAHDPIEYIQSGLDSPCSDDCCSQRMPNVACIGWTGPSADIPRPSADLFAPASGQVRRDCLTGYFEQEFFLIYGSGKTNAVMERLKNEAAKLGANGILLSGVGDQASGSVGSGFGTATGSGHTAFGVGFGSSATVFQKKGDGMAIYVESDQVASR